MTAKFMVRFYAVTFNKIGVLLNEIYVDIRSKFEAHKLIKDWIQKHRPGAGFLRHSFLHFPILLSRAGPLLLPKGKVGKRVARRAAGKVALSAPAFRNGRTSFEEVIP